MMHLVWWGEGGGVDDALLCIIMQLQDAGAFTSRGIYCPYVYIIKPLLQDLSGYCCNSTAATHNIMQLLEVVLMYSTMMQLFEVGVDVLHYDAVVGGWR